MSDDKPQQQINFHGDNTAQNQVFGNQTIIKQAEKLGTPICPTPPPPPDHFGGRDEQMQTITDQLSAGGTTSIAAAVQGLGGIGKTALARQLAHRLHADGTFGAVLWSNITRQPYAPTLLQGWATACGLQYDPSGKDAHAMAQEIRGMVTNAINKECDDCQRVLVVLDDVWDNGIDTARLLRQHAPHNATVLVTTRSEKVANRIGGKTMKLDKFDTANGVRVLRLQLENLDVDDATLTTIVEALGGHALALKLAAQRALDEPERVQRHAAQYQRGIPEGEDFKKLDMEQDEDENNLRVVLSYSYDLLNDDNRRRFRYLGAMLPDQPFDQDMLQGLWGMEDADDCYTVIKRLRQLALIELDADLTTKDKAWYRQHRILYHYARSLLKTHDELPTARDAYTDVIIKIIAKFYSSRYESGTWVQLTPYCPHINTVGDELIARYNECDDAQVGRLREFLNYAIWYLDYRKEYSIKFGENWLEAGIRLAKKMSDEILEIGFTNELALLVAYMGKFNQAISLHEANLKLVQENDDKRSEAAIYNNLGMIYNKLGDIQKALEVYNKSLSITYNREDRGAILNNLGMLYDDIGQKEKALECYKEALTIAKIEKQLSKQSTTLDNMAKIYYEQGETKKAIFIREQAIEIDMLTNNLGLQALHRANLATSYYQDDELDKAIIQMEMTVSLMEKYNLDYCAGGMTRIDYSETLLVWKRLREEDTILSSSYMSREEINTIVNQTIAVKIIAQQSINQWRDALKRNIRIANFDQSEHDMAFFIALLAVLADQPATLPDDNPYAPHLARVKDGIANPPQASESAPEEDAQSITIDPTQDEATIRAQLKAQGVPEEHIDGIMSQVRQAQQFTPPTMPQKQVEMFVNNTIAVKTFAEDKLDEWKSALQSALQQAKQNQREHDAAFFTALLAVLADQPATLPDDNPYAPHLARVKDGIANPPQPSAPEEDDSEAQAQAVIAQVVAMYREQGEDATRQTLKNAGLPDEIVDGLIAQIKTALGE